MPSIAIVDDEAEVRTELHAMLDRYASEAGAGFKVAEYACGEDLIRAGATEDIILLDIEMAEMNGMQTAQFLRKMDVASEIIFVTNMAQYAIKGYEVRALDFMVKPVRYPSFSFKLSRALEVVRGKGSSRVAIATKDAQRYVDTADIIYVEVRNHRLTYHTTFGICESWGTLKSVREELEPYGFALCNACYLVNLACVTGYTQDTVTVKGGDELKMSRGRKREFLDALTAGGGR